MTLNLDVDILYASGFYCFIRRGRWAFKMKKGNRIIPIFLQILSIPPITKKTSAPHLYILGGSHFFLALFLCPPFIRLSNILGCSRPRTESEQQKEAVLLRRLPAAGSLPRSFSGSRVCYPWKSLLWQKYFPSSSSSVLTQQFCVQEFMCVLSFFDSHSFAPLTEKM